MFLEREQSTGRLSETDFRAAPSALGMSDAAGFLFLAGSRGPLLLAGEGRGERVEKGSLVLNLQESKPQHFLPRAGC